VLVTDDVRHAAAVVAKQFYRDPSAVIPVVGVTGTNGKTSVATMLHRILGDNGVPNGLLATTGYRVGQRRLPAPNTTPNALDLQAYLREMVEQRQQAAIMEVSSHALDQQRVRGVEFACAVITNLTQDHLDYHGDMERYRAAKLRLFQSLQPEAAAVVPVDDEVGRHAAEACGDGVRIVRFGLEQPAEFSGRIHAMTLHQTVLDLETPNGSVRITLPLSGLHNVRNALAAAAAGDIRRSELVINPFSLVFGAWWPFARADGEPSKPYRTICRIVLGMDRSRISRVCSGSRPLMFGAGAAGHALTASRQSYLCSSPTAQGGDALM
jgi:UDP-N-acetylmuramoyl-L-alanyl-D-glutamate--2,6-diaminopimelate ligase